ncbi:MAG: methyltransferase domain-containing protein [bacterium]
MAALNKHQIKPFYCEAHAARDSADERNRYYGDKPINLMFLLENRYSWMNRFLSASSSGLEVGSGSGLSREYVKSGPFLLSDFTNAEYLDVKKVDALNTPFRAKDFDFVVASHVIHHVPNPMMFFSEMARILKPGGLLLINEVKCSILMRAILRLMNHESYDYGVSVYDRTAMMKLNADDRWEANCAVPDLLFDDLREFDKNVSSFKAIHHEYSECIILLNSGGVDRATLHIPLFRFFKRMVLALDRGLISLSPDIFAMSRRVVLQKRAED